MTGEHYTLGWLPAVLPADARRFRVAEPTLGAVLAHAGAELVDAGADADVEVAGSADMLEGRAPVAIVSVPPISAVGRPRLARAAAKAGAAARALVAARRARRQLSRLGYSDVSALRWDVRRRAALPGFPEPERSVAERLPGGVLAVGSRGSAGPTVLEAALEAAGRAAGAALRPRWVSIRPGPVLAVADTAVLRVAIGPSRVEVESQAAALEALAGADVPPLVADRIPWLLARGEAGLAGWSLERLRPGTRPARPLSPALVGACIEFLVALHGAGGAEPQPLGDRAETLAAVCGPDAAARVRELAGRLEAELGGLTRGFAHGDFFPGNLLASGDRLTGVLDWDAGGPGRLPLLDLLHLRLTAVPYGGDERWGRAVLDRLLPLARAGGDETLRRYCSGVRLDPDPRVLEALVLAYWLEYAAYQLRTHPDRRGQRAWIEGNVELVLREARAPARPTASAAARGALTREA
jgi:aminoglycoside phosphotransferase (APT) family kinase protein